MLGAAWCGDGAVHAQDANPDQPVTERDRPAVDAQGVRLGSFTLYPRLILTGKRNDNLLADDDAVVDDNILQIAPELSLVSGWSRHSLSFGASADIGRHSDVETEDFEDSRLWVASRFDARDAEAMLDLSRSELHEDRALPTGRQGLVPTTYSESLIDAAIRYQPGRFSIGGGISIGNLTFDDVADVGGTISNADQDREQRLLDFRGGYLLQPGFRLFAEGRFFETDYDREFDNDGFQRSSEGQAIVAGAELDLTGKLFGEVFYGYREHEYEDPRFGQSDGPTYGVDLTWNATGLTTLNLSAARRIAPTTIVGASETEVTEIGLNVDHELRRNLVISIEIARKDEDFTGVDRKDDSVASSISVLYMMNRKLHLDLGYSYDRRESSGSALGRDFRRNIVFLSLIGQI